MRDATEYGPLHRGMTRHRKTRRLARLLGIPEWQAMGIVTSMWCECLLMEPDGVLEGWDDDDIADAIGYDDSAGTLVESLISSGWLERRSDGALIIHEAREYHADMRKAEQREYAREKKRRQRAGHRGTCPADMGTPGDMSPNVPAPPGQSGDKSPERRGEERRGEQQQRPVEHPPNASETEREDDEGDSLEAIVRGARDALEPHEATARGGPAETVWSDHTRGLGQRNAKFAQVRSQTTTALRDVSLSELAKASLVVRRVPWWRNKSGQRARDAWVHILAAAGEYAQAYDELGVEEAARQMDRSRDGTADDPGDAWRRDTERGLAEVSHV